MYSTKFIEDQIKEIDKLSHYDLVAKVRFAPPGDPIFKIPELSDHFFKRLNEFGGITPEISKEVGWQKK